VQDEAIVEDSIWLNHVYMCEGVQLRRCNIDRKMVVPAGEEIGVDLASDRQRFQISDSGIIVISRHDSFTRA